MDIHIIHFIVTTNQIPTQYVLCLSIESRAIYVDSTEELENEKALIFHLYQPQAIVKFEDIED